MNELNPNKLSIFYHRLPHLNTTLHKINSTFDSTNHHYLTSLNIIGSIPPLILIILLILLLIYLLTRCCDRRKPKNSPNSSACCVKVILATFAILCCCTLGLGLYGNDDLHNSLNSILKSIENINKFLQNIQAETRVAEIMLRGEIPTHVRDLANEFDKEVLNRTVFNEMQVNLQYLRFNISLIEGHVSELSSLFNIRIDSDGYINLAEMVRWYSTLVLLILFIIFNIVLFYAISKYSRCSFITFSVLGLFAVITNWTLVSIYLVSAVATGDFCISPLKSLTRELVTNRPLVTHSDSLPPPFPKELLFYYINCPGGGGDNPLRAQTETLERVVEATRRVTKQLKRDGMETYNEKILEGIFERLFESYSTLDSISSKLLLSSSCSLPHKEIVGGAESLCNGGLIGLTLLLLSSLGAALLFTLLVAFDSHAWIYIQKRKNGTVGDESLSFLGGGSGGQSSSSHRRGTGSSSNSKTRMLTIERGRREEERFIINKNTSPHPQPSSYPLPKFNTL